MLTVTAITQMYSCSKFLSSFGHFKSRKLLCNLKKKKITHTQTQMLFDQLLSDA